jgi:hypothetical protein
MTVRPIAFKDPRAVAPGQVDSRQQPRAAPEFFRSGTSDGAVPVDGNLRQAIRRLSGNSSVLQEIVRAGGKQGDAEQIEFRLRGNPGAARSRSSFHRNTLLHETCLHWVGHPDQHLLIKHLIRHGADVDAKNSRGETALDIAVKKLDPGRSRSLQALAVEQLLQHHASSTPGVLRKSEDLARRGDPWLREAIAKPRTRTVRL